MKEKGEREGEKKREGERKETEGGRKKGRDRDRRGEQREPGKERPNGAAALRSRAIREETCQGRRDHYTTAKERGGNRESS